MLPTSSDSIGTMNSALGLQCWMVWMFVLPPVFAGQSHKLHQLKKGDTLDINKGCERHGFKHEVVEMSEMLH